MRIRCVALVSVVLLAGLLPGGPEQKKPSPRLRVPPGFVIEKVAGEPDIVFPMFAAFDDRGRLFVTESSGLDLYKELQALTRKCRISVLDEPDAAGRFRRARVFADKLVFPMGLAWRDGKLYVPDPPDLVTLEDTDGDGKADRRTVLLGNFVGHRDNGSLHGLTFGPDGLLYMTTGDPDGYRLKQPDGTVVHGFSGALLRCRPDGSQPEVLCRGFENLVEVAFTPRGDILGTNNWYLVLRAGLRDSLVHLVEGGLYPRHRDKGSPLPLTGEPLPAVALFPAVALSGLTLYRGDAFPPAMRGNLFSAQHNARKVQRHVLVPDGSTFRTEDFDFVTTDDPDFHPSDVLEAPDGSLLVVDTGSWYVHHCPTGQIRKVRAAGGIYRVRAVGAKPVADPLGLKIDWAGAPAAELARLLADRRPVVRDRAQRTLSARGKAAVGTLASLLEGKAAVGVKQHAVWALAGVADDAALPPLRKALADAEPDVAATAARGLALRKDRQAAPVLARLLRAAAPQVRLAAAQALAHCGTRDALPALWQALAAHPDRFLEHGLIHAAHRLADADALTAALRSPEPGVQKAALLLLDQPPRPRGLLTHAEVIRRVGAPDAGLRQTARAILERHLEWAEPTLGVLRQWLEKKALSPEEQGGLRGLLLAFQKQPAVQQLAAEVVADRGGKVPAARRLLVLEAMSETSLPKVPPSWAKALGEALRDPAADVRLQAVRTAAVLQVAALDERLAGFAEDGREPTDVRLQALRAVVGRRPRLSAGSFDLLAGQLALKDNPLARLSAAEILGRARLNDDQELRLLGALRGESLIAPAVLLPALQRSVTPRTAGPLLRYLAESVRRGWRPSEPELRKVLQALPAEARDRGDEVLALLRKSAAQQAARLREFEPLLQGGRAERGRAVFFGPKAACATCHTIGTQGGRVGPDLTRVGAVRSGRDLLESVVLPSSTVAQGYENYQAATKDGRVFSGVIARQSADVVVLRDSSGAEVRLGRAEIDTLQRQATSLMPEGLERQMSTEEFRDLLAFLQALK
jgi:putative membrane-bound dehydrogenase-like protein